MAMHELNPGNRFAGDSLDDLRRAVADCRACPLWARATQAVPGEGPPAARVMLVGEQPGDKEDVCGHPFVGPAGQLLDEALAVAGVDRQQVFVTNAVKHFSWIPRGKRRMHKTPAQREIAACVDWLEAEIALVQPKVVVCLGATAAKVLLGKDFRVSVERGRLIPGGVAPFLLATMHPSSILRLHDAAEREAALRQLATDLRQIHVALGTTRDAGQSA